MNKYLNDGDLSVEELKTALRIRTISVEIVPVLCGTAFKNKGVQAMLDAVVDFLPSPVDIPDIKGNLKMVNPIPENLMITSHLQALLLKL